MPSRVNSSFCLRLHGLLIQSPFGLEEWLLHISHTWIKTTYLIFFYSQIALLRTFNFLWLVSPIQWNSKWSCRCYSVWLLLLRSRATSFSALCLSPNGLCLRNLTILCCLAWRWQICWQVSACSSLHITGSSIILMERFSNLCRKKSRDDFGFCFSFSQWF